MDSPETESTDSAQTHDSDLLIGEDYEAMLKQSIQELVDTRGKSVHEISALFSKFFVLMRAKVDPPLEAIWVYSSLSFRGRKSTEVEPRVRFSAAKDLFELLQACSAPCGGLKSIALLAPVMFEVYALVVDMREKKDLSSKRDKKTMKEIESLIEVVLGYISVCRWEDSDGEKYASVNLISSIADLVRVWVEDRLEGNREAMEALELFFPILSEDARTRLNVRELDISYLAGVVVFEAFLLRMCLKFGVDVLRSELQKDLRTWAVGSINSIQSYYFFEVLVRMLLEPTLPLTSLLESEDELLLRKILYDAVILVDYSFLKHQKTFQLPVERMKSLAMTRLIVAHEAIEFYRERGDQTRAVSYINAFSRSSLPSQIIKWVTSQISWNAKESKPYGSSPKALIRWLLELEGQGLRIFNDSISKCRAKLALDVSKADYEQPLSNEGHNRVDADLLFYIDNKGVEEGGSQEDEKIESTSAAFIAASHTMSTEKDTVQKRKMGRKSRERKKHGKILKYDLHDISNSRKNSSPGNSHDDLSSDSEVENPPCVEDKQVREQ
ncbi:uncharacterized protein LOC131158036 [Malania oleifera]|uniref:uncharacterized protein LOC131158036 n=1 Tax=Malania oleifera TaxID=397392 RepID=UPI0025AEC9BF|nr:uncharacterized protein LOC131158036 [Malania oleifera]